jgi:hypothetical protein
MLASVGERLLQTLSIQHLAFFLVDDSSDEPSFHLKKAMGPNPRMTGVTVSELDLSFLDWKRPEPYIFFERTRHQLDAVSRSWPASVRKTIADFDAGRSRTSESAARLTATISPRWTWSFC